MGGYDPTMNDDEIAQSIKILITKEFKLQIKNYQNQFMAEDYVTPFEIEEQK